MFNVTAEQLNAAHGQVRCGHCETVFDALGSLQDDWKDHIHEFTDQPETESFEHELVFDEAFLDNTDLEYNVKPDIYDDAEELPVDDILQNQPVDQTEEDAEIFPDDEEDNEPSALAELSEKKQPDNELEIIKLRKQSETLIRQLTREISEKSNIDDRYQSMSNLEEHTDNTDSALHPEISIEELIGSKHTNDSDKAPAAIREELEEIQSGKSNSRRLNNFLLFIAVVTATIVQTGFYFQESLAQLPLTRPVIESLCEIGDCDLPLKNDAAIGINSLIMRSHSMTPVAEQEGQLRIQLLFTNSAKYAQVYPIILITMSNEDQVVTAMRQVTPQEYLGPHININEGLPAQASIDVSIDVIKPDTEIHSYEFDFL